MILKNKIFTLLFILFTVVTYGQQQPFVLKGQIVNGKGQELTLNNFVNGKAKEVTTVALDEDGKFEINGQLGATDYFQLILTNQQSTYVVISPGDTVKVFGDAKDLFNICNVVGSEDSEIMQSFLRELNNFKSFEDSLKRLANQGKGQNNEALNQAYSEKATNFFQYRNRLIQTYGNSPGILFVLNTIDTDKEFELYEQVVKNLITAYQGSPTGNALNAQYSQVMAKKERDEMLNPGKEVADISMKNPDGETMSLSDLKGKVVLIDFWASWCGPCRKENPNVVKAYNEYKDKGFTVYSVSLDKDKNRWLQAIEQDGLIWPNHVSDLKGWSNAAAQNYGVSSIPFTVLIDQEGKVIATNVRGEALEKYLAGIFEK